MRVRLQNLDFPQKTFGDEVTPQPGAVSSKPASRDLPRNVRKERLSTKAGKQPKPRSFPASASGAQSVLADNPLVPVSSKRMEMLGRGGVWEPGRVWVDLTPTLGVVV